MSASPRRKSGSSSHLEDPANATLAIFSQLGSMPDQPIAHDTADYGVKHIITALNRPPSP